MNARDRLGPETLAILEAAKGVAVPVPVGPYVEYATVDTIRHFARAYGDDNPLFGDERYAAASVRGGLIAPPLFALASGTAAPCELPLPLAGAMQALAAIPFRVSGDDWWFHEPIRPGTRLERVDTLHDMRVDDEGIVTVTLRSSFSQNGVLYTEHDRSRSHGYESGVAGPVEGRTKATYTEDEIAAIEAAWEAKVRRGVHTRHVDEVHVGDTLPVLVKGPLTMTDMVAYRAGVGPGPFGVEPFELALANRRQRPGFYSRNDTGAFEPSERTHWDELYAKRDGHPTAWDYTTTRLTWATQLLTDWVGDEGWLASISFHLERFNYLGDTHRMTGRVEAVDAATGVVSVRFTGTNQRDEVTCGGQATVALPVR